MADYGREEKTFGISPHSLLVTAVWLGLLSGMFEGGLYLAFQHWQMLEWTEALTSVGPHQVFVSAVVNALLLLTVGSLLALLGTQITWQRWPAFALGILIFLSLLPLLDFSGRIRMRAAGILAIGLTIQILFWAGPRKARVLAFTRRTLPALAAVTILAGLAVWLGGSIMEQFRASRLPPIVPGSPNILLIVLDTARADHLSCYGYDRLTTPNLDALAAKSVVFERAYATSSWTPPSHASLMTGLLPSEHGMTVRDNRAALRQDIPVLTEELSSRGYLTAGFASNTMWLTPWMGLNRGFVHYKSYYLSLGDALRRSYYGRQISRRAIRWFGLSTEVRASAAQLNSALLSWLESTGDRPFFAFMNYMEAHAPNQVPPSFEGRFKGASPGSRIRIVGETLTEKQKEFREKWLGRYDTGLHYLDSQLGLLLEELKERGLIENTLIIVTSDHGEAFGRHGLFDHANALYEELIHVPLIVHLPRGEQAGHRVRQPVSIQDLPATVMELLGAPVHRLGGRPLSEFWENPSAPPRPVIAEIDAAPFPDVPSGWPVRRGWLKSITLEQWKLILHQDGSMELFDLAADPLEQNNLALQSEHKARAEQLRDLLKVRLSQNEASKNE